MVSRAFPLQLSKDLLHPTPEEERTKHKLKRLVQSPNSFFMDVKCPGALFRAHPSQVVMIIIILSGCYKITTVFSHAQTVVLCVSCSTVLAQPTGGRARLTEGMCHILLAAVVMSLFAPCRLQFQTEAVLIKSLTHFPSCVHSMCGIVQNMLLQRKFYVLIMNNNNCMALYFRFPFFFLELLPPPPLPAPPPLLPDPPPSAPPDRPPWRDFSLGIRSATTTNNSRSAQHTHSQHTLG